MKKPKKPAYRTLEQAVLSHAFCLRNNFAPAHMTGTDKRIAELADKILYAKRTK